MTEPHQRILHVLALATGDGRYGGPQRVALELAEEQRRQGHSVKVVAGGILDSPLTGVHELKLFPVKNLVPGMGYAGLIAPSMILWLIRNRRSFDIVHVHLARDLTTLPSAAVLRLLHSKYVAQTHGMVDRADNPLGVLADFFATKKVLKSARAVLALTEAEAQDIRQLAPKASVLVVDNGAPVQATLELERDKVTFLARLHPRKGGATFAKAAGMLSARYPSVRFVLAGPDEGDLDAIRASQASTPANRLEIVGPIPNSQVPKVMASSLIYVLPAPAEPFGMTILEAMSQETPVILHKTAELAVRLREAECFETYANTPEDLAESISRLLDDANLARIMGQRGRQVLQARFSISRTARTIMESYEQS